MKVSQFTEKQKIVLENDYKTLLNPPTEGTFRNKDLLYLFIEVNEQ